jgi:hypothetical protein
MGACRVGVRAGPYEMAGGLPFPGCGFRVSSGLVLSHAVTDDPLSRGPFDFLPNAPTLLRQLAELPEQTFLYVVCFRHVVRFGYGLTAGRGPVGG